MIAAQLYTVRERLHDRAQVRGVLATLREIGYVAVEVAGLGSSVVDRFGEDLEVAGIVACAAHESLDGLVRDLTGVASRCARWGCRYVTVPSLPTEYHSEAGFRRFAAEALEIAEGLRPYGLRLAYHNHAFELERLDGVTGLEVLFDATSPEILHAELDTYWLDFAGADPAAWIRRMTGRLPLVHLKDVTMIGGKRVDTEVGEGDLDWPAILVACREAGAEWLVVEQDRCPDDPLNSLAVSYRNLTRLLSNMTETIH